MQKNTEKIITQSQKSLSEKIIGNLTLVILIFYAFGYIFTIGIASTLHSNIGLIITSPFDIIEYSVIFVAEMIAKISIIFNSIYELNFNFKEFLKGDFFNAILSLVLIKIIGQAHIYVKNKPMHIRTPWKNYELNLHWKSGCANFLYLLLILVYFYVVMVFILIPYKAGGTYSTKYIINAECRPIGDNKHKHDQIYAECVKIESFVDGKIYTVAGKLINSTSDHVTILKELGVEKIHTANYFVSPWDGAEVTQKQQNP